MGAAEGDEENVEGDEDEKAGKYDSNDLTEVSELDTFLADSQPTMLGGTACFLSSASEVVSSLISRGSRMMFSK